MPRGFHRAAQETREAYETGKFTDKRKRSFIGRASDGSLHELLAGTDKVRRHDEVMERAKRFCQGCATPHYIGRFGVWHHLWQPGRTMRCDCTHSALWVCEPWHKRFHVGVRWTCVDRTTK